MGRAPFVCVILSVLSSCVVHDPYLTDPVFPPPEPIRDGSRAADATDPEYPFDQYSSGRRASARQRPIERQVPWHHHPLFSAHLTVGGGQFEHETEVTNFDDDGNAAYIRGQIEGHVAPAVGFGVAHQLLRTDDDMFENVSTFTAARTEVHDTFVYLLVNEPVDPNFRIPIRLGPYFHYQRIDEENSTEDITWMSVGGRINLEPEIIVARSDRFEVSVFGDFSVGVHGTRVDVDTSAISDRFDTDGATFGIESGLRLRFGTFSSGISYLYRYNFFERSDPENGVFVREVDDDFRALVFSIGTRF